MKIAPPDEGANRVLLKKQNEQSRDIGQVDETPAIPPLTPVGRKHERQPRSGEERRQQQRRQQHEATVLDTRSPHERRVQPRRQEDREDQDPGGQPPGIDVEA